MFFFLLIKNWTDKIDNLKKWWGYKNGKDTFLEILDQDLKRHKENLLYVKWSLQIPCSGLFHAKGHLV